MDKVVILIGSHTIRKSVSQYISKKLVNGLHDKGIYTITYPVGSSLSESVIEEIIKGKVLIIISPVYIDAPPSKLLKAMSDIYAVYGKKVNELRDDNKYIFGLSNCGFYEPIHNQCVLNIIECFGKTINRIYLGGIGIGCGQLLTSLNTVPIIDSYIRSKVEKSINDMSGYIEKLYKGENTPSEGDTHNKYVKFRMSKFTYKVLTYFYWYALGKKNGLRIKDYYYCPY